MLGGFVWGMGYGIILAKRQEVNERCHDIPNRREKTTMKKQLISICTMVAVVTAVAESSCIISGDTYRMAAASAWSAPGNLDAPAASWGLPNNFDSVCWMYDWGEPMNINSRPPIGTLMIFR